MSVSTKRFSLVALAILTCFALGVFHKPDVHAQSAGDYNITSSVIAAGGGTSTGTIGNGSTLRLDGTIGQAAVGASRGTGEANTSYVIYGGFIPAAFEADTSIAEALAPAADTWVQGADAFRNTNYGASAEMQVKRTLNPGAGRGRRGFIRFDTSGVTGTILSAKLRIYARLTDASLPPTGMIVQKVTDTTWDELGMTWNNQPLTASPAALAQVTVASASGAWYEFNLTSFIQQERAEGRTIVSLRLINQSPTGNSGAFYTIVNSREAASEQPQLVIEQ